MAAVSSPLRPGRGQWPFIWGASRAEASHAERVFVGHLSTACILLDTAKSLQWQATQYTPHDELYRCWVKYASSEHVVPASRFGRKGRLEVVNQTTRLSAYIMLFPHHGSLPTRARACLAKALVGSPAISHSRGASAARASQDWSACDVGNGHRPERPRNRASDEASSPCVVLTRCLRTHAPARRAVSQWEQPSATVMHASARIAANNCDQRPRSVSTCSATPQ